MLAFDSYPAFLNFLKQHPTGVMWQSDLGFTVNHSVEVAPFNITYIAKALHPEVVSSVITELSSVFELKSLNLHPLSEKLSCDGLTIKVRPRNEDNLTVLKENLASIAKKYAIDLTLTSGVPSLSKPGLLVMDMDSTMIQMECIDEIARLANRFEDVAAVTEQAMQGKLDFTQSLKTRVACLKGVEETALLNIRQRLPLMPGLVNLVTLLKQYNWKLAIASGGFTYFADYLKDWLALDDAFSNVLGLKDGALTGETEGRIVDAAFKAQTVGALREKYGIDQTQTVAMGDGANDLLMIGEAQLGVAFHAKPAVQPRADAAVNLQALDALILLLAP